MRHYPSTRKQIIKVMNNSDQPRLLMMVIFNDNEAVLIILIG